MAPLVAVWGYRLNDTSFTVIVGALALALFFALLSRLSRHSDSARAQWENLALTGLFGF